MNDPVQNSLGQWVDAITGAIVPAPIGSMSAPQMETTQLFRQTGTDNALTSGALGDDSFGLGSIYSSENGILGTGVGIGDVVGLGNLYLGYQNMKNTEKFNAKQMEAMDQNLKDAKTESAATQAYRAAYGA